MWGRRRGRTPTLTLPLGTEGGEKAERGSTMKNTKLTTKLASRRTFLKRTAAAVGVVALSRFTARSYGQIGGANEAIRLAVVGCNDCGRAHINQFGKLSGVRIVALCDVDTAVLDRGMTLVAGAPPRRYGDVRKVLDEKGIDAISSATPNHWHALI